LLTASKQAKAREARLARAIFHVFSNGVNPARDAWTVDVSDRSLVEKIKAFLATYNDVEPRAEKLPSAIKWSRNLKDKLKRGMRESFTADRIGDYAYRPFSPAIAYFSELLIDELGVENVIGDGPTDRLAISAGLEFRPLATDLPADFHFLGETRVLPRHRYNSSGERIDNITDWALNKFTAHYGEKAGVTKDTIFAYCYAVLNDPVYREKYALNLKREFPRIPFYDDFAQWAGWGQQLLDLHIGYEKAKPFKFTRVDTPNPKRAKGSHPKPKLKSEPEKGLIIVDEDTQLTGIPREAWTYRLGNRSAIDWVLDQHKEKTPRDPTVREKFNTYRFTDYKESMIDLLARVVTVSLETVKITEAMRALERSDQAA
jgi:predicted helicase